MRKDSKLEALFTSIIFALFVFSGFLKWIPYWPSDPTLLFGIILAALLVKNLMTKHLMIRRRLIYPILFASLFFVWYLLSATYSMSDEYWRHKATVFLLTPIAFFFPIVTFKAKANFIYFKKTVSLLAFLASSIILYFYFTGALVIRRSSGGYNQPSNIPDYLALGGLIGLGILLSLSDFKLLNIFALGVAVPALLTLGSRGPTIFVFLCGLTSIFLFRRSQIVSPSNNHSVRMYTFDGVSSMRLRKANRVRPKGVNSVSSTLRHEKRKQKRNAIIALSVVIALIALAFYWKGGELLVVRFKDVFQGKEGFEKAMRLNEFSVAFEVIGKNPIMGVGLGGYGRAAYGIDESAYPHNILLEAYAEAGIPGVMLLTFALLTAFVIPAKFLRDKHVVVWYLLALFILLNYMKSGGFVGTRDLFAFIGVLLAYLNIRLRYCRPPG